MAAFGTQYVAQLWTEFVAIDALTPITLTSYGTPVLNIDTGVWTTPSTAYAIDAVLSGYRRTEIDGVRIVNGDMRLVFPQTAVPMVPDDTDEVTAKGVAWNVVIVTESGNGGLWVLQLRRPGGP